VNELGDEEKPIKLEEDSATVTVKSNKIDTATGKPFERSYKMSVGRAMSMANRWEKADMRIEE
jgi:hypothetical protein